MSDLDAFFAKKDRRKRRSKASKSSSITTASTAVSATGLSQLRSPAATPAPLKPIPAVDGAQPGDLGGSGEENVGQDSPAGVGGVSGGTEGVKKRDDGWIELEEEGAAQVHTGGRTIVELKRDEDKVENETTEMKEITEKFAGWQSKVDEVGETPPEGEDGITVDESKFPTLAETKDAPQVPASASRHNTSPELIQRRPSAMKFRGLQKLAERLAQQNTEKDNKPVVGSKQADIKEQQDQGESTLAKKEAEKKPIISSVQAESKELEDKSASVSAKKEVERPEIKKGAWTKPLAKPLEKPLEKSSEKQQGKPPTKPTSSLQRLLEMKKTSQSAPKTFPGLKGLLKKRSEEKGER